MIAVQPLAAQVGVAPACQALGVSRASFYRRQRSTPGHQQPRPTPARALCEAEREQILDVLAGPRFVDRAPAEVVATLLDEGHYLCSERTMYRILAADQPVRERRNQREHPQYTKPELVATAPNQTWSWDITKLLGPTKWTYFYLYVVLDIFSRYAVGWMVADRENSALAGRLIEETCHNQGVQPQVLTLHSDRGAPMTSKCTAQLLADLGVTRSLSRPQVSDDNPFSEAQFKTLKYHPGFPGRFHDITAAIAFCRTFFPWYNTEHRHGGIAMLTPDDVHHNRTRSVLEQRGRTLQAAWTPSSRTLRSRNPTTGSPSPSRLDQPTCDGVQQKKLPANRRTSLSQSRCQVPMSEERRRESWRRDDRRDRVPATTGADRHSPPNSLNDGAASTAHPDRRRSAADPRRTRRGCEFCRRIVAGSSPTAASSRK